MNLETLISFIPVSVINWWNVTPACEIGSVLLSIVAICGIGSFLMWEAINPTHIGGLGSTIDNPGQSMTNYFSDLFGSQWLSGKTTFVSGKEVLPDEMGKDGFLSHSQPFLELLSSLRPKPPVDYKADFERSLANFHKKLAKSGKGMPYQGVHVTVVREVQKFVDFSIAVGVKYGKTMAQNSRCWIKESSHKTYEFAHRPFPQLPFAVRLAQCVAVLSAEHFIRKHFPFDVAEDLFESARHLLVNAHFYTEVPVHALENHVNHMHNNGPHGLLQAVQEAHPVFIESHVNFDAAPAVANRTAYSALLLFAEVLITLTCIAVQMHAMEAGLV